MAFGQTSGPPAGSRQLDRLAELLERAGFSSFKEARHPYGLTQRQAGGKFTVAEADLLIERLEASEQVAASAEDEPAPTAAPTARRARGVGAARSTRSARTAELLPAFDDATLVAELERRGWCCIPPITDDAEAG
jgi:hypothetical protein